MQRRRSASRGAAASLAAVLIATLPPRAWAGEALLLDIPAGPLAKALQVYIAETHQKLLYSSAIVAGRTVPALRGRFTPEQALQLLLAGSHISAERSGPAVLLRRRPETPSPSLERTSETVATSRPDAALPHPNLKETQSEPTVHAPAETAVAVEEVVVTGTHIRGVRSSASPVITITKAEMFKDGAATVAESLSRLPQNFNGVQSPVNSLNGSDRTGTNNGYAQGVNLRGLGASATLVLLDGRRLAGTGNLANFADVSALPTAAVDHVEVLLDGASAIYGSDAVAGVVNIITRSDYRGADTTVRYGLDEGGVAGALQASQTFGLGWTGGHLLATYDYQHSDRLPSSDRRVTADSDLRALGGTNRDAFNANPGNILGLNAEGTGYVPIYAIPSGDGVNLKPSDFVAGSVNYLNTRHNTDVTPDIDQSTFFADLTQELGDRTRVDLEGRYSLRHFQARQVPSQAFITVTPKNPFYVSPNGAASELIGYSLDQVVGPEIQDSRSKSFDLALGLNRDVGATWRLSGYLGFAGEEAHAYIRNLFNTGFLNEALGNSRDNPATTFSTAVDGFFNPYGSGSQNSARLKAFVGSGTDTSADFGSTSTASLQADGVLFSLPAGPVRGAFGGQYRHERLENTVLALTNGPVARRSGGVNFTRDVSAAFGELSVPLIAPAMSVPGVRRLDLSLAGRFEHYDDVGSTTNPKVGLTWEPLEDLAVHATYGTSFRAPSLSELSQPTLFAPVNLSAGDTTTLVLLQYGGNMGLRPETATTWTAGVDWRPKAWSGLHLGVNWFDIDFTDEIDNPGVAYLSTVLSNPALASLVTRVDPQTASGLAVINAALAQAAGTSATLFPASAYGALVDARYLNTASMRVAGLDVNADYAISWRGSTFSFAATGSYLDTFSQRQVRGGPLNVLLDTPNQPVSLRGRASADWTRGPYEARLTVNYTDSYKDPVALRPVDSWTTVDFNLIWRAPADRGPLKGATASVFIRNLFGSDPPFYDNPQSIAYDSANADPFGRVLAVEVTKRW